MTPDRDPFRGIRPGEAAGLILLAVILAALLGAFAVGILVGVLFSPG